MDSLTRRAPHGARLLLGLIFLVFGLNFFLQFLPAPPMSGPPMEFAKALVASGFVMTLVKVVEVGASLMLLSNRFVPLALALLAPIVVNIVGFHLLLAPAGAPLALLVLTLELWLAWSYRGAFTPMLKARHEPVASGGASRLAREAS